MRDIAARCFWVLGVAGVLAAAGSGCVPVFRQAPPIPEVPVPDAALLGAWRGADADGDARHALFYARHDGWLDIVYIHGGGPKAKRGVSVTRYEGVTTRVDGAALLAFRAPRTEAPAPEDDGFLLARYEIVDGERLQVWLFGLTAVRTLIESERLAGLVDTNGPSPSVTVTAAAEDLLAALRTEGIEAFIGAGRPLEFVR